MLSINRQSDMVHADEWPMKVAFASSDYRHVDQHPGATPRLVVYGAKINRVTLLRVVELLVVSGHQTEKIAERTYALEDCVILLCVTIGEVAFRQLLQVGARAERVPDQTTTLGLLQETRFSWYEKVQRRSTRQRDLQRFNRLLEEPAWWEEFDPLPRSCHLYDKAHKTPRQCWPCRGHLTRQVANK